MKFTNKNIENYNYERRVIDETNKTLVDNFFKCADWIKENYPNLTATFHTRHDVYFKLDLIVENGVATLAYGSHGAGYAMYLSKLGSAFYSQGSCQCCPYLFEGLYGFRDDKLVKFLEEWEQIKNEIISKGNSLNMVYSNSFIA